MASNDFVLGLKCRVCGKLYPKGAHFFCADDSGPLEVAYDYEKIKPHVSRAKFQSRPKNMWRYRELLPLDGEPTVGPQVGGTPLIRADRLADALGVERLWIKNDAVNFPTLSFKDRVVSVALSKARELGMRMVGCASTGNLANSVAALSASAGLEATILVPADLERVKILGTAVYGAKVVKVSGTYDQVNRLCTQIVMEYGWGFVNVNLRPFYAEGSKTVGFEIAEDLGWRFPQHVVCPMAGGALIGKIHKGFTELSKLGLVDQPVTTKMYGAQAAGCNPIADCVKSNRERHKPVRTPNTICKSLAIGDPADGYFAAKLIRETGGWAEDVTDAEIVEGMQLLAKTEGVFAETAGGTTLAVAKKLIESGRIPRHEEIVICITGNGLKTQDAVFDALDEPAVIKPALADFKELVGLGERAAEPVLV
ncbi:Threonine synthase [Gemmata obscuriglobus]|uniref:Threonine synthase n=1 Tax=Gemmata obscuriglobus TaxID=114 RepID=A0A2Z3GXS2_9BACT|nr:threonine synthase [Gemmata obscuriglobus]AWM36297.1 threonine synthase [Gemmata obscuriglobus]QEG31094.1 Threonine synthase [Gemmata obscuriglobus]VTS10431.1 threonine synthase : Threonine synthase OS=Singulisphaera acidiphila (strain ATCC BAA-1392 / DSM 18658 / VKM B-2454 / MOB10) GN=Sinac_6665 PE=4 SV=1: PALP [Gemmata obscuriglobus UQM 2246]